MSEENKLIGICVADNCNGTVTFKDGKYVCEKCGKEHSQWEMEYQEEWRKGVYHGRT